MVDIYWELLSRNAVLVGVPTNAVKSRVWLTKLDHLSPFSQAVQLRHRRRLLEDFLSLLDLGRFSASTGREARTVGVALSLGSKYYRLLSLDLRTASYYPGQLGTQCNRGDRISAAAKICD